MNILNLVERQIILYKMLAPGEKVLAACSGGCDSMALTHILCHLQKRLEFQLTVANLNHMLRPQAKEEAVLVKEFCSFLKIPYYHQTIDVANFAQKNRLSRQEAARIKRYEYLQGIAQKLGGAKIATGHHLDDQAETVLINLLRGSGSGGLSAIKPCAGGIIRPLLALSRAELENYCKENNIPFCQDMSNFKTDYLRNSVRLKLIPHLAKEYNNNIAETLAKTAEISAAEHGFIRESAVDAWQDMVTNDSEQTFYLNITNFNRLHLALQRELIRQIIEKKLGKLTGISFVHVESLIKLAISGQTGSIITLPHDLIVEKTYTNLIFTLKTPSFAVKNTGNTIKISSGILTINALTPIPELNLTIDAKLSSVRPGIPSGNDAARTAVFDYDCLELPLFFRTRLPGDRFTPSGFTGSKKLKDFFIDQKIPQKARDFIPLILDQKGIIWVAGYRRASRAPISAATENFLKLTVIKQKGS